MGIGAMLGDVVRSLFSKPATEQYPFVKSDAPVRLRGKLEYDSSTCTGCNLCVKDCPAFAIEIITIDKKAKRFVMHYHADKCVFCAQCVESCRVGCLSMSNEDWELASTGKAPLDVLYGKKEDIQALNEQRAQSSSEETLSE